MSAETRIYIGKAADSYRLVEVADEAGEVVNGIRFGSVRTNSNLAYVGIEPPPPEVRVFRLDAPIEGLERPEEWQWTKQEGSAWYTRDLCAVRVLIA